MGLQAERTQAEAEGGGDSSSVEVEAARREDSKGYRPSLKWERENKPRPTRRGPAWMREANLSACANAPLGPIKRPVYRM